MKFKNAALVVSFVILCLQASSAWAGTSYSSNDLYYLAQKSYYKFKRSPGKQRYRHHWEKVIQKFAKVVKHYPKSRQAYKATFTMASLYQGLNEVSKNIKDLDQALRYYKKVYRDFSGGTLTDDALFELAKIYLDKKDLSSASRILKIILKKYPNGDQIVKARQEYQNLMSVDFRADKQKILQPVNTNPVVMPKEEKLVISKLTSPSKKTKLVESGSVKQLLEPKVKAKEKKKSTAQHKVPQHLKKVIEKTSKDKVNVVSNV
ncbi:MAG: tetratricopeptide repeat protein, partial [Nitrospina sp.]|nr:tetratricopeptide repeat protein [Nitrospina sp.]